jgi:hypothetical protein
MLAQFLTARDWAHNLSLLNLNSNPNLSSINTGPINRNLNSISHALNPLTPQSKPRQANQKQVPLQPKPSLRIVLYPAG